MENPGAFFSGSAPDQVAIAASLGTDMELERTLRAIAQVVVEVIGFGVAVINLVQEDTSVLVATVAGPPEIATALLGQSNPIQTWHLLIADSEPWGQLRFLSHDQHSAALDEIASWVPSIEPGNESDSWHPEDSLFAPLTGTDGLLLGVLSVDLPPDGRRPGPAVRRALEAQAAAAALAIENVGMLGRMRRSEALFRSLFEHSPIPIALLDDGRRYVSVNPAFARFMGREPQALVGQTPAEIGSEDDREDLADFLDEPPIAGQPLTRIYVRPDGTVRWGRLHHTTLDSLPAPVTLVQIEDVTESREAQERLRHDAHHDAMTGLPNRVAVLDHLRRALARRHGSGLTAVLFCDVDDLKGVNDRLGHAVGDEYLRIVANRITGTLRAGDMVGRIGGDEFIVVADRLDDPVEAATLAARITAAVAGDEPLEIDVEPSVSVGVGLGLGRHARQSAGGEDGWDDADVVLGRADAALYDAKRAGRGLWRMNTAGPWQDTVSA